MLNHLCNLPSIVHREEEPSHKKSISLNFLNKGKTSLRAPKKTSKEENQYKVSNSIQRVNTLNPWKMPIEKDPQAAHKKAQQEEDNNLNSLNN